MINSLASALKIGDLRQKLLFTLLMLFVFRLGAHVPVPGINTEVFSNMVSQGALFGFFDVISGGAFKSFPFSQ